MKLVNFVCDRDPSTSFHGALVPYDGLVNPIVMTRRIGLSLLTAECGLGDAILALIHCVTG